MKGQKVISLDFYRKRLYRRLPQEKMMQIPKKDLLEQLLLFYEDVKEDPYDVETALYGEDLMEVISKRSLTRELHELAELYLKKGPHAAFKLD